jgi:hypothetical protein
MAGGGDDWLFADDNNANDEVRGGNGYNRCVIDTAFGYAVDFYQECDVVIGS